MTTLRMSAMRPVLAALLLAAAGFATAQAQDLVAESSEISFTSRQMGVPVVGRFRRFSAEMAFDPRQPAAARIGFVVDLGSAEIGDAETTAELRKPDWFNVAQFPQARFRSTGVKPLEGRRFEVTGELAIKGATRPVVVPVTLSQAGALTTAAGSFTVRRLDFQIGIGDWKDTALVADPVEVRFKLVLKGVAPL